MTEWLLLMSIFILLIIESKSYVFEVKFGGGLKYLFRKISQKTFLLVMMFLPLIPK